MWKRGSAARRKGKLFQAIFLKNVKICHFCRDDVFGSIILDYAPGEFFVGIYTLGEEAAF